MSGPQTTQVINNYMLDHAHPIAQGVGTKILKAVREGSSDLYAVKIIDIRDKSPQFVARARQEAHLHQILTGHRNIIRTFATFEHDSAVHIVMEYLETDLLTFLIHAGGQSESDSRKIFKQLRKVMSHLRRKNIVHGDLKLENILFDPASARVVLIDFGSASIQRKGERLAILTGTQQYVAPEILHHEEYDGFKSDLYSLGVVLFAIVSGRLPFEDEDGTYYYSWVENYHEAIGRKKGFRLLPPAPLSPPLKQLLQKMLTLDPKERPTLKAVKKDCWYRGKDRGFETPETCRAKSSKNKRLSLIFFHGTLSLFS